MGFLSSLFSRSSSSDRRYHRNSHRGGNHYRRGYGRSSHSIFSVFSASFSSFWS